MDRAYSIHEIRHTLQGEGANTGKAVILVRFSGCNLSCPYCDTEHEGTFGERGGVYSSEELAAEVKGLWPPGREGPLVLCTGGEPLLQLDKTLVRRFSEEGMTILLETNGTVMPPGGIHWVCVSPKDNAAVVRSGDEVKIVWPSETVTPELWETMPFRHRWLQPRYDRNYRHNLSECIRYCMENPAWRLGLQTHRYLGIP